MEWALLGILIFGLLVAYTVWQGARGQLKYRQEVQAGNLEVIKEVVETEMERWRTQRPPRGVPPSVWHGVRTMEVASLGADHVHVRCNAEGQYRMAEGRWQEVSAPLQEGMAIAAKGMEMLLYDVPHFQPQRVRMDVYTTFRDTSGSVSRGCILSCSAGREEARQVDWDNMAPPEIIDDLGGRYRLSQQGAAVPIDVDNGGQGEEWQVPPRLFKDGGT
ncbi:MAG: hypothetical protein ACE5IZ_08945 [Dehalococcoidia bacterium]